MCSNVSGKRLVNKSDALYLNDSVAVQSALHRYDLTGYMSNM